MNARVATTRIDLLRHGRTTSCGCYGGSHDAPLTPRGWKQMRSAIGQDHPWKCIISSPLRRCIVFARELARRRGLPLEIENRLREYHFGAWEGKSAAELLAADPEGLARFWENPVRHPPPGGEDLLRFRERVLVTWHELLARYAGEHLLIVTHGGPIRVILGQARCLSFLEGLRLEIPHASLHRVNRRTASVRPGFRTAFAPRT